jgi:hypothetical protein
MRKLVLVMLMVAPLAASAATWANAPLVDHNCMEKVKANPDAHTTACLLQCASSGYGILEEGKWIPFDKAGNEKVVAALKATQKKDHIRVNVTGKEEGSKIHVTSLSIAP